jgi:hypothetical protein
MLQGSELLRLLTGLVMLALVAMLMVRTGEPDMWRWVANSDREATKAPPPSTAEAPPPGAENAASRKDAEPQGDASQPTPPATMPDEPDPEGTDRDPDESAAAANEFQVVVDGELEGNPEEQILYDRIVRWVQSQPYDALRRRARTDLMFTDFYQRPKAYRGQIVALDLNVRRVRDIGKNTDGVSLTEVWGFSSESGSRLYEAVVVDFPPDMPKGARVVEKAKFVGYFFKLQGYIAAGATMNAPREKAPLLIGRLRWEREAPAPARVDSPGSTPMIWWVLLLAVVAAVFGLQVFFSKYRRRPTTTILRSIGPDLDETMPIEAWLERPDLTGEPGNSPIGGSDLHDGVEGGREAPGGGDPANDDPNDDDRPPHG